MAGKVLFVVNVDTFFVSHRMPLGLALRDAGYDVTVAAGQTNENDALATMLSGAREKIEKAGLRFIPLPLERGGTSPPQEAKTLASLVALYQKEKPDIVHHVSIKPVLYGTLAARLTKVPKIINAISGLGFAFIDRADDPFSRRMLRAGIRQAYRTLLHSKNITVIFQNPDDRQFFVSNHFIRENQSRLIRGSGVNTDLFSQTPIPEGDFIVMLPTRLLWDKGVREFVEAAQQLKPKFPHVRFVMVGPIDPDNPAAVPTKTIEEWVTKGVVEWWGPKQKSTMPQVLSQAHLVVLPSYREGLPLTLAEASSVGRACITTDVPGCREVIQDGVNGWLVPVRDSNALAKAMTEAIENPDELNRRAQTARTVAERDFSITQVVKKHLDIYAERI